MSELNDYRLVAFFKAGCPTCQLVIPELKRLAEGVVLVAQEEPEQARRLWADWGLELPFVCDPEPCPLSQSRALTIVPTLIGRTDDGEELRLEGWDKAVFFELVDRLWPGRPSHLWDDVELPDWRPG